MKSTDPLQDEYAAYERKLAAIPEAKIAWFAGWLCADGSILDHGGIRLRFSITDRDPLEKFAELFGNNVTGPFDPSKYGFGIKPVFVWAITGVKARALTVRCRPWLSERYGQKADDLLRVYSPRTHRGRKVSPEVVLAIQAGLEQGRYGRALAKRYGVSDALVSAIKVGRKWSHVTGIERQS